METAGPFPFQVPLTKHPKLLGLNPISLKNSYSFFEKPISVITQKNNKTKASFDDEFDLFFTFDSSEIWFSRLPNRKKREI